MLHCLNIFETKHHTYSSWSTGRGYLRSEETHKTCGETDATKCRVQKVNWLTNWQIELKERMKFPKPGQKSHRLQVRHAAELWIPNHPILFGSEITFFELNQDESTVQTHNLLVSQKHAFKWSVTPPHPDELGVDTCDQKRHTRDPVKLNYTHGCRERMQQRTNESNWGGRTGFAFWWLDCNLSYCAHVSQCNTGTVDTASICSVSSLSLYLTKCSLHVRQHWWHLVQQSSVLPDM